MLVAESLEIVQAQDDYFQSSRDITLKQMTTKGMEFGISNCHMNMNYRLFFKIRNIAHKTGEFVFMFELFFDVCPFTGIKIAECQFLANTKAINKTTF